MTGDRAFRVVALTLSLAVLLLAAGTGAWLFQNEDKKPAEDPNSGPFVIMQKPPVPVPRAVRQAPASGSVSPEDFGARGDGVADDGPALQRALDQAAGRPIQLSGGRTYRSEQTLLMPSHTTLRGPRSATLQFTWTRRSSGTSNGPFFLGNRDQKQGNDDIVLRGFSLRGPGDGLPHGPHLEDDDNWPPPAIRLRAVNTLVIRDLDVGYVPAGGILYQGVVHARIEENHVHHTGRDGITGTTLGQLMADVVVRANLIERVGDDAIGVIGSTSRSVNVYARPTGVHVLDNTVLGWCQNPNGLSLGRGIVMLAVSDTEVRGNRIECTASAGILVRGSPNPDSIDPDTGERWRSARIVIHDNTVRDAAILQGGSTLEPTTSEHGIEVRDADTVHLRNNSITDSRGDPVFVEDCRDCSVEDALRVPGT